VYVTRPLTYTSTPHIGDVPCMQVPYEQLCLQLEERTSEAHALRVRLAQSEASLETTRHVQADQAASNHAEIERLTQALAAAPREDTAKSTRQALQRLAAEVGSRE
jgi:hypothetical protein